MKKARTREEPRLKAWPRLNPEQQALLKQWVNTDASKRRWETLLAKSSTVQLEMAQALLEMLVQSGLVRVHEQFRNARWWPHQIEWLDLANVQEALGLSSAAQRQQSREQLLVQLQALGVDAWLGELALDLAASRMPTTRLQERCELLQALRDWQAAQRQGMRQDFALFARPHTKAVSKAEWDWLEDKLPLDAMGIERFAPVLWLAADLELHWADGQMTMVSLPFVGLPSQFLAELKQSSTPRTWWFIENRASFERQARLRQAGQAIVWLAGRPATSWLAAMRRLFELAPAPVLVSTDLDPAGLEIAATAGALCEQCGVPWQPHRMELERLSHGKSLGLNDYDQATLKRLFLRTDLHPTLSKLAQEMQARQCKREQEAWV